MMYVLLNKISPCIFKLRSLSSVPDKRVEANMSEYRTKWRLESSKNELIIEESDEVNRSPNLFWFGATTS